MGMMSNNYVGHINCEACGFKHIKDPLSVTIWFCPDSILQLTEVICPGCGVKKQGRIDIEDFMAFRSHGVQILMLNDKFEELTEETINSFDIDREFASSGFDKLI